MSLLDEIQADLVNESASLSNILRKAKILSSHLRLPEFREWVDQELGGYSDDVPSYRTQDLSIMVRFLVRSRVELGTLFYLQLAYLASYGSLPKWRLSIKVSLHLRRCYRRMQMRTRESGLRSWSFLLGIP